MGMSVSEIKAFGMRANLNSQVKGKDVAVEDSFSTLFDKTQNSGETQEKLVKSNRSENDNSLSNHAKLQRKDTTQIKESGVSSNSKVEEEQMEAAMEETAAQMVEKVAEVLEIPVEDLESVLEALGLTAMDLFNSENLIQVFQALNPEADALAIMTNEELFADFKELMDYADDLLQNLGQELQLPKEELKGLMDNFKAQLMQAEHAEELPQEVVAADEEAADGRSNAVQNLEQPTEGTESAAETEEIVKISESHGERSTHTREDSSNMAGQNFQQNILEQLEEAVAKAEGTTNHSVSGSEIIRQITESIKVNVNADTKEMELQLHPASLGNVKVQIASREGILTAVFTTENEAVKTALETQLVQLKNNFEEQGLKVESVEVNVSAQAFERSLDEQEHEAGEFQAQNEKKRSRRIRLDGLEALEDAVAADGIAEEDRVVADMMIRNGNSVDYTV